MATNNQHQIDACNLLCPMPVLKLQQAVKALMTGDQIKINCTDPSTVQDIPSWCRIHGHKIISISQDDVIEFVIEVQHCGAK